jgi:hypothetical protein
MPYTATSHIAVQPLSNTHSRVVTIQVLHKTPAAAAAAALQHLHKCTHPAARRRCTPCRYCSRQTCRQLLRPRPPALLPLLLPLGHRPGQTRPCGSVGGCIDCCWGRGEASKGMLPFQQGYEEGYCHSSRGMCRGFCKNVVRQQGQGQGQPSQPGMTCNHATLLAHLLCLLKKL